MPIRTIGIMLLTCALIGWVAMAPGAAARQPTEAGDPTAGIPLLQPPTPVSFSRGAFKRSALMQSLATGAVAEGVTRAMSLPTTGSPKNPKIDSHLVELAAVDEAQRAAGGVGVQAANLRALPNDLQSMVTAGLMRIDDSGRVQVYLHSKDDVGATADFAGRAGGLVQRQDAHSGLVQALVPISQVKNLAASPAVRFIRLPDYGIPQAGSVTTEGDAILKANLARSEHGIDGTGVRVGVISGGHGGLSASQASGDLPSVNLTCESVSSSNAEGTAMMEIVHDIAPGAELWFASSATSLDFNAAVNCLAANTDVVVDDEGFPGIGPYDGTSSVSANTSSALNNGANPIRAYVTAAGNFADQHYQEPFGSCPSSLFQMFQATSATTDVLGFGQRCDDPVAVAPGVTLVAFLQWNDPWGASCNNYDLYLYIHDSATLLASSTSPQSCSQDPTEVIVWTNPLASPVLVDLAILKSNGAAPRTLELFTTPGGAAPLNFDTPGSSIPSQADAGGGVISASAIDAADPGNVHIEAYSGRGPTNDGRTKPDITGIDDVSITGDGGFGSPFPGTSAAAPHIAGIAALLLQCKQSLKAGEPGDNPGADRTALRTGLLSHAVDLGPAGPDDIFGAGRADAQASANAVCPSATPTPSPTPTHSPTPTPTHSPTPTPIGPIWGDLNCTGGVGVADVMLGLKLVAGVLSSLPCAASADVDCNGVVNGLDVLDLLRFVDHLSSLVTGNCRVIGSA